MVTGDYPLTAKAIAQQVGIISHPTAEDLAEEKSKFSNNQSAIDLLTMVPPRTDSGLMPAPRADLPVLLIVGKDDPTANQGALEVTKKLIPQVKIELIEGVGHWVMVECKDHINESIPRFLQSALSNVHTKL